MGQAYKYVDLETDKYKENEAKKIIIIIRHKISYMRNEEKCKKKNLLYI